jgi:cadmium resistance transport/sequestration family protein
MSWLAKALIAGFTSFVATNIDDVLILLLFFSQVNASFRPRHIVTGQYLGFAVLILASLPGFFGGLLISKAWIGLLGFLPIAIGIIQLLDRDEDETEVQAVSDDLNLPKSQIPILSKLINLLAPQSYQVAAVTVANGGDNIGIYVPLFASSNLASLGVILGVFFVLVGVWCSIADQLARHPAIAPVLTRYGQAIVPFVLIGLGVYILLESRSYQLLPFYG